MKKLFEMLKNGGVIVSSASCNKIDIVIATECNRFYVDEDGFGFVYFPTPAPSIKWVEVKSEADLPEGEVLYEYKGCGIQYDRLKPGAAKFKFKNGNLLRYLDEGK